MPSRRSLDVALGERLEVARQLLQPAGDVLGVGRHADQVLTPGPLRVPRTVAFK